MILLPELRFTELDNELIFGISRIVRTTGMHWQVCPENFSLLSGTLDVYRRIDRGHPRVSYR